MELKLKFKKYGRKGDRCSLQNGIMKWCILEDDTGGFKLECLRPEDEAETSIKILIIK